MIISLSISFNVFKFGFLKKLWKVIREKNFDLFVSVLSSEMVNSHFFIEPLLKILIGSFFFCYFKNIIKVFIYAYFPLLKGFDEVGV